MMVLNVSGNETGAPNNSMLLTFSGYFSANNVAITPPKLCPNRVALLKW